MRAQRLVAAGIGGLALVMMLGLTGVSSSAQHAGASIVGEQEAASLVSSRSDSGVGSKGSVASAPTGRVSRGSMGLVALTFDDGPSVLTGGLLDVLKSKNARATFFLQGDHALANPALVRRIHDEGHVIGNHGWSHRTFDSLSPAEARREIVRTNEVIKGITGETPTLFRYPHGTETDAGNKVIRELGMWGGVLWHWDSGAGDYTCPGERGVERYLNDNAVSQAVLLLHDGNEVERCPSNQPVYLARAIDTLRDRGFELGVVASAGGPSWVNQHSWVRVIPAGSMPAASR